ncbi:unnamed protein product, partial [Plutella xylostella]
ASGGSVVAGGQECSQPGVRPAAHEAQPEGRAEAGAHLLLQDRVLLPAAQAQPRQEV